MSKSNEYFLESEREKLEEADFKYREEKELVCELCGGDRYVDMVGSEPDDITTVRCPDCNPKTSMEELMDDDSDQGE